MPKGLGRGYFLSFASIPRRDQATTSTLHTADLLGARAEPRVDLDRLLHPRSVAVFGASDSRDKFGGRIMHFLVRHGFAGEIYPINPRRSEVLGRRAFPSIAEAPAPPDVAILAVGADALVRSVSEAAADQVRRGARARPVHRHQLGREPDPVRERPFLQLDAVDVELVVEVVRRQALLPDPARDLVALDLEEARGLMDLQVHCQPFPGAAPIRARSGRCGRPVRRRGRARR